MRVTTLTLLSAICAEGTTAHADNFTWDSDLVGGTYSIYTAANWVDSLAPINAAGNIVDLEVDNTQRTYDINNGGANFDMGLTDRVDIGRGVYLDSSGSDDAIIGNVIAFNGSGGQSPVINVPVIANTMTSNRHGAVFNAPITVDTILANSGHQDHWEINVSPTGAITHIDMDENRGPDGGDVNGYFEFDADAEVATLELTWSRLRIGGAETGAQIDGSGTDTDVTIGALTYWDYTNQAENNSITPIEVLGTLDVGTFNWYDVASDTTTQLANGTYGMIGTAASVDFEVPWITAGDGILTVGSTPAVPGDTDGDGDIDDSDLGTSFSNYTGPVGAAGGKTAADGDTDGDGDVDDSDLGTSFSGYTGPLGPASVPEPTSLALLGLGGLAMIRRRRA